MSVDQAYNYKKINDLVSTAGLLNEDLLKQLKSEGYEAVISLLPFESEYAIENEPAIVEAQNIIFEYVPVDFLAPSEGDYRLFSELMTKLSHKKIMVHCAANYRVSAFYAIYSHLNHDWTVAQAKEHIASIWDLAEYPVWNAFVTKFLGTKSR